MISRQCKAEVIKRVCSEEDVYIGQRDKVKRSEVDPYSQLISATYQDNLIKNGKSFQQMVLEQLDIAEGKNELLPYVIHR